MLCCYVPNVLVKEARIRTAQWQKGTDLCSSARMSELATYLKQQQFCNCVFLIQMEGPIKSIT